MCRKPRMRPSSALARCGAPASQPAPLRPRWRLRQVPAAAEPSRAVAASLITAGALGPEGRTSSRPPLRQLKKAVQQPENRRTPEARELLGVAYQKARQTAAAKEVYEITCAAIPRERQPTACASGCWPSRPPKLRLRKDYARLHGLPSIRWYADACLRAGAKTLFRQCFRQASRRATSATTATR